MKKLILLIIICLSLSFCQKIKEKTKIVGLDWIVGNWKNISEEGKLIEIWKKINDSVYDGQSFFIRKKDTLHSEKMELIQKGENLFYISTIKGQNNDKPIQFNHNTEIEKQLVFENPKNEYPQKISYTRMPDDKMFIQIEGIQQGKSSSMRFAMKKSK